MNESIPDWVFTMATPQCRECLCVQRIDAVLKGWRNPAEIKITESHLSVCSRHEHNGEVIEGITL